jgi:23S rRNA (uracil1939-C5)-methyltransferase
MDEQPAPIFTVTLDTLVYGGDAMGRLPDGRAVFVPFTLPGEIVRVRLLEEKRGFARGEVVDIVQASPDRITPRCAHYAACGGCHYQHMPYERQLAVKTEIVRDQLQRIGNLQNPLVEPIVPSPKVWNYRNNVQFHLTREGKLGFQEPNSNRVVAVEECVLCEDALNEIWPQIEFDPGVGIDRASLRVGVEDEILLILEGPEENAPEFSVEELPISAVYLGAAGMLLLAGSEYLIMEAGGRQYKVSARSFFQVNQGQAENLLQHVLDNVDLQPDATVLELYSGVGLFSAFLAERAGRLVAVEESPSSASDFEVNLDAFDNVELYEAPAELALPGLDLRPDLLLVDPPRSGLGRKVVQAVIATAAPRIVYISCDPATLARDARYLVEAGYHLEKITPFDMFPQTFHIETVSWWKQG